MQLLSFHEYQGASVVSEPPSFNFNGYNRISANHPLNNCFQMALDQSTNTASLQLELEEAFNISVIQILAPPNSTAGWKFFYEEIFLIDKNFEARRQFVQMTFRTIAKKLDISYTDNWYKNDTRHFVKKRFRTKLN